MNNIHDIILFITLILLQAILWYQHNIACINAYPSFGPRFTTDIGVRVAHFICLHQFAGWCVSVSMRRCQGIVCVEVLWRGNPVPAISLLFSISKKVSPFLTSKGQIAVNSSCVFISQALKRDLVIIPQIYLEQKLLHHPS